MAAFYNYNYVISMIMTSATTQHRKPLCINEENRKFDQFEIKRKGNVPCLPSVKEFSSKLAFNMAEHLTLL